LLFVYLGVREHKKVWEPLHKLYEKEKLFQVDDLQMDRTSLRSGFCRSNVEMFEKQYHIPYTEVNCEFFVNTGFQHDCSFTQYYGLKWGKCLS